jgi:hypothetical protein
MSTDNLSRAQFGDIIERYGGTGELFHGTNAHLRPGQLIEPGRPGNWPAATADTDAEHVFASLDPTSAYHFAASAVNAHVARSGTDAEDLGDGFIYRRGRYTPPQERRRTYRVEPTGPMERDAEIDEEDHEYTPHFQSKHPLRVVGEYKGAREAYTSEYGEDIPFHTSVDNPMSKHQFGPHLEEL